MGLADRGGSSGFVGQAWGEICRDWLAGMTGNQLDICPNIAGALDSVVNVDAIPGLAAFASSRGLQNPDFMLTLRTSEGPVLVAADAKFSIETAKPRQVSAEILAALLDTPGTPVRAHVRHQASLREGFFITPDYELTHLVMNGSVGILRTAVGREQVCLLETDPILIFGSPEMQALMDALAAIDGERPGWRSDLVAALYYARCAFASIGCRIDEIKPLLGSSDVREVDDPALLVELLRRGQVAASAWQLVRSWDRDAEEVRAIRIQVRQAADIGVPNRDLRQLVEREAERLGCPAPSVNRVRRDLSVWATGELVRQFGVVCHPVTNLPAFLADLKRATGKLHSQVPGQIRAIVGSIQSI